MPQLRPVDLEGRVALVTGGADEVGAAFADLLGSAGAEVAVAGGAGPSLERMAIRFGVETFECDPFEPGGLREVVGAVGRRLGRLDVLVCAHGTRPPRRRFLDISCEDYRRTFAVNLDATFAALQEAGRTMVAAGRGGRIVVVGLNQGAASQPEGIDFYASQAALRELIRGAAFDLDADGVTVNGVFHGPLRPEEPDQAGAGNGDADGTVEAADVARAALWLVDPEISGVTGSVVDVAAARSTRPA
jgi:NAD(P)-dependent dehydrogenase (short-subunit alcohol dehydrogenase family)